MYKPFKIHKSKNRQFYLTIVTENGRTILTSETYTRKRACYANVKAVARLIFSALPMDKLRNYIEDTTLKPKQS